MANLDIARHLAEWGLRRFPDEDSYYAWQRESLTGEQLRLLQHAVQIRREAEDADQAFYDLAASPDVLPVLYSQRYGYYNVLGPAIADALAGAQYVLDVGCGVGILTTWYATRFPDVTFVGVDRSLKSIEMARQFAQCHQLENASFHHCEIPQHDIPGTFDTIVATQALFQSESDPGLPSRNWTTRERDRDARQQQDLEERTGLGPRLDRLLKALVCPGRIVLFEKAVHLGRRVLFQRALEARSCVPVAEPQLLTYSELGEAIEDGPLYVVQRGPASLAAAFREDVPQDMEEPIKTRLTRIWSKQESSPPDESPLYENHSLVAQEVWRKLPDRVVLREQTDEEADGRQRHIEYGRCAGEFFYLYWANTFDQRQIVIMEQERSALLESYYSEAIGER
ncbi:MAG: methyltransferase domain-containing protein [Nitrospira sp.]|nr:methyltransferase domain-containing protein [Nitrospira sp.]